MRRCGEYRWRIEAREPSSRKAARGAAPLEIAASSNGLDLSDVVLADRVAPRGDTVRSRRDFLIDPNPAQEFAPGQSVDLYWEVYGLHPDSAGVGAFTVSVAVRLQSIERHGLAARLFGGVMDAAGVTAEGDDQVVLSYAREMNIRGRDRVPEYLTIGLQNNPEGLYTLEITVLDRRSGQSAVRSRTFTVKAAPSR